MTINITNAMEGRTMFFTGVTGFVGKVFLYKVLKEFPDMKAIYCLVRTKKGQDPFARFAKEVLKSLCFEPLKKQIGEEEFARRVKKVIPVAGDMMQDNLGLSAQDYSRLCSEVNYIVHLAATVDFQEKLNISVKMNVLGPIRVMALARKCVGLEAVVHTSTCYVNWNRASGEVPVREQIYALPFDAEDMCKYILSLHERHIAPETEKLLAKYNFPNTYTFTKSICEQIIFKHKGTLPLSVVRPAIIGCSWKEPCPGWIDVLTAAGAIVITAGLGILKDLHAKEHYVADLVPVDYVCNTLLKTCVKTAIFHKSAAAARAIQAQRVPRTLTLEAATTGGPSSAPLVAAAQSSDFGGSDATPPGMPFIFQSCTSGSQNRFSWFIMVDSIRALWSGSIPHPKRVSSINCTLVPTRTEYLMRLYVYRKLPFYLMKAAASLPPPIGSKEKSKLLSRYEKALRRTEMLNFQFRPFTTYQWLYENTNSKYLDEDLDEESLKNFGTDVFDIQWWTYCELYSWGMTKFIMKAANREQPVINPSGSQIFLKANL